MTLSRGTKSVPLLNTGIAWPSDKKHKFRNPEGNLTVALKGFAKPKFWSKALYQLDENNPTNNGFEVIEVNLYKMFLTKISTFRMRI